MHLLKGRNWQYQTYEGKLQRKLRNTCVVLRKTDKSSLRCLPALSELVLSEVEVVEGQDGSKQDTLSVTKIWVMTRFLGCGVSS